MKRLEVAQRAVVRVDVGVVGDVVAVVAQRRGIERQQPDRGDAEVLQVVELRGQAAEVADAVAVAVEEGPDVDLVDDRVLVPERIGGRRSGPSGDAAAAVPALRAGWRRSSIGLASPARRGERGACRASRRIELDAVRPAATTADGAAEQVDDVQRRRRPAARRRRARSSSVPACDAGAGRARRRTSTRSASRVAAVRDQLLVVDRVEPQCRRSLERRMARRASD